MTALLAPSAAPGTAPVLAPVPVPAAVPAAVPVATGPDDGAWLTATVRPAGMFGRADAGRLRALLDALSACASLVVLDLRSARLRDGAAAAVVDEAAGRLESRGGCLLCVNADPGSRANLSAAGPHTVLLDGDPDATLPRH
ncbi:hypothetical protein [Cellulomonas hominis]